jgi:dephospho-CoA kinase
MTTSNPRPFVIGVTGDIACGKSTVLGILGELGVDTIDADMLYHGPIEPGKSLWHTLVAHFGTGIVAPDSSINRAALGAIVFSNPDELAALDRITHPAVVAAVDEAIGVSTAPVTAVDAVKLVESGMSDRCDQVWLVVCDPAVQLERLITRNGLGRDEALRRIVAQGDRSFLRERADVIIDNSDTLAETRRQVEAAAVGAPILPS